MVTSHAFSCAKPLDTDLSILGEIWVDMDGLMRRRVIAKSRELCSTYLLALNQAPMSSPGYLDSGERVDRVDDVVNRATAIGPDRSCKRYEPREIEFGTNRSVVNVKPHLLSILECHLRHTSVFTRGRWYGLHAFSTDRSLCRYAIWADLW